jgi:polysaccharide biosynthesis transport protein
LLPRNFRIVRMSQQTDTAASREVVETLLSPLQLWKVVRKQWLLILAITVAITLGVTFYTMGQTKIYRAVATIQIDPSAARPLGNDMQLVVDPGSGNYWANKEYYGTQYSIIQSRRVAEETVRALGLQNDGAFLANLPLGETAPPVEASIHDAAGAVRSRLRVDPVKDTRLVEVTFEDANPERAQRILTTLVDIYVEQNVEDVVASTSSAGDWLRGQQDKLKRELEGSELALHQFKKDKRVLSVSIDDQSNMLREEMSQLSAELTRVRAKKEGLSARAEQLAKVDSGDPSNLPATELLQSSVLSNLRGEYVQAKRERDSLLSEGKGQEHPAVRAAAARMKTTRDALVAEIRNIQRALTSDVAAASKEAGGLSKLFKSAEGRAMELNLMEIEYGRLRRAKDTTEKLYSVVQERAKESDIGKMMRFNNIAAVDRALLPTTPVRPRVPFSAAMGAFGGLMLGLMLALSRELLDRTIKTPDDAERDVGLTFLGLLPQTDARTRRAPYYGSRSGQQRSREKLAGPPELIVHSAPTSGVAEAARAIRTNLVFMAPDNPYRRLLITSAGPSEGKTTVACSIAIAMAQAGQRVLLMDCDLRRPRVHKVFGIQQEAGVSTACVDRSVLDQAIYVTEIPNLSVLPAGLHAPNPAELLQSESFSRLLEELGTRFDRIMIDSPPVVPVTDAAILSNRVDGVVLVVRAAKTSRDLAQQAKRTLSDVGAKTIGVVLNAVDLARRGYGYYSQYYYYKRDGYESNADDANS